MSCIDMISSGPMPQLRAKVDLTSTKEARATRSARASAGRARTFLNEGAIPRERHRALRKRFDEGGNLRGRDRVRLTDDERGMQAVGGDEVGGLELPAGRHCR
jgi:hypothetical protein